MSTVYPQSVYPPAAVARAVAAISVALPGAPATARARLAAVLDACDSRNWSDASQAALARQTTAWLALAHFLKRSVHAIRHMEATDLLDLLHAARFAHGRSEPAVAEPPDEPLVVGPLPQG